jgi:hypothetical protein
VLGVTKSEIFGKETRPTLKLKKKNSGKGTLLGITKSEVFGNQRHGIRFLSAAQGRLLDVKVFFLEVFF